MNFADLNLNALQSQLSTLLGANHILPEFSKQELDALYALAYDYHEKGCYEESTTFFRLLTTANHAEKKHWIGLASSLQMMKKYEEAANMYGIAFALDQTDPYLPFYAAECCFSQGDTERGLQALEAVEELLGDEGNKELKKRVAALQLAWSA